MSDVKEQEAEIKACEACAEEAEKKVEAAEEAAAAAEETAAAEEPAAAAEEAAAETEVSEDDAAGKAKKKKIAMIVRIIIWAIVLVGAVYFLVFKDDIMQRIRSGKIVQQITDNCKTELGITPFSVKYIGNNRYEVTFKNPDEVVAGKKTEAQKEFALKLNKSVYTYDLNTNELILDKNDVAWNKLKVEYMSSRKAKNDKKDDAPAEKPAEKPAEPAKK